MNQKIFKLLFLLVAFTAVFTSCTDDGGGTTVDNNPKITFDGTSGADAKVKPCEPLILKLTASKGSTDLNAIEVTEDGTKVSVDRISFKGVAVGGNPILLTGTDRTSLTGAELKVLANCAVGAKKISVSIIDAGNLKTTITKNVTTEAISPTSKFNGPDSLSNVSGGTTNLFNFDVTKGSGKIVSVEVQENGVKIADVTRLSFDGKAFTTNPETLAGPVTDGFTSKSVGIKLPTAAGRYKYTFIFKDEFGLATQKTDYVVNVGTPTTFMKVGALFNQAGPAGTGGLDLDGALGTGSGSLEAEVADLGIDGSMPNASNWKQQIKGVNGTELKVLKKADFDINFSLANVKLVDQIAALHTNVKAKSVDGQKIVKDDVITAKKGSKYYIFVVTDVVVTAADNNDKYQVDIKW